MELKIQISDDVSFASSLGAILSSLSEEQKTKLAADMLRQFLTEPADGERRAFESKLIAEIGRLSGDGYTTARYSSKAYASMSADEIRGTRDFSARMDRFVSVKETMIAQVTTHAKACFEKQIAEAVKSDPQIQIAMAVTLEYVKENFPAFVSAALTQWFASHMEQVTSSIANSTALAFNAEILAKRVAEHLGVQH